MPKSPEDNVKQEAGWSSRSIGRNWQHQVFYLLIQLGGRRAAYLLLYFVVAYYVLFSRLARKRAQPYLSRRYAAAGRFTQFWHCYRLILCFGKVLIDRAVVGILGSEAFGTDLNEADRKTLLALRDEGRGLIMMSAHVGCWQVAMSALEFLQRPVNMLMRHADDDIDRQYYEHRGESCPYRMIDPTGYLGGTLEMLGALKQGQILCVMGDRVLGSERSSVEVDFLAEPVAVPFSAYKLAATTGAPIVIFFTLKDGPERYRVQLARIIRVPQIKGRKAQDFQPYAAQFATALEAFCQVHPTQFFNFFDLWQREPLEPVNNHKEQ